MVFSDPISNLLGNWSAELNVFSILLRLFLAILFASIVGWERSNKRHAAGLRTFIIVFLATTLAMIIDLSIANHNPGYFFLISAASIVGIAIMSTNTTIYSSRSQIKGLTTSVALFGAAFVGLSIGAGLYVVSIASFAALLLILSAFPALEVYLKNRSNHFEIHLELKNSSYLKDFVTTIRALGLTIDDIESNPAYINSGLSVYTISVSISSAELKKYKTHKEIIEALRSLEYVYHIEEI